MVEITHQERKGEYIHRFISKRDIWNLVMHAHASLLTVKFILIFETRKTLEAVRQ